MTDYDNLLSRFEYNAAPSLCVRLENGKILDNGFSLESGGIATLDTYFNSLSCKTYSDFTNVKDVALSLHVNGSATVEIRHLSSDLTDVCIADTKAQGDNDVILSCALPIDGILYARVCAEADVIVSNGAWIAQSNAENDVNLAVVICTYKREKYVTSNVNRLVSLEQSNPSIKFSVYVVDNGNTLCQADVEGAILIPNRNLGGSGGFCRGMYEAYASEQHSHVLLMDDDITFSTAIIERIVALLRYSTDKNMGIGGAMLCQESPETLFELGASWNGFSIDGLYKNIDVSKRENLLLSKSEKADYSAWWCCCFPVSMIEANGLPLPFFIKMDDVEYGIRCKLNWAFANGIGVWHESFDAKYSPHLEYYLKRNENICNSLHPQASGLKRYWKLIRSAGYQLVLQRYFALPYVFKAYDDFLKGADYFVSVDEEKLNAELMAMRPKFLTKEELEAQGYSLDKFDAPVSQNKALQVLTLNGHLIPSCFYPKTKRGYVVVDQTRNEPADFFMRKTVVQYNPKSQLGFVTSQKRFRVIKTGLQLISLGIKMAFKYQRAKRSFQKAQARLTSFELWKSKFDK